MELSKQFLKEVFGNYLETAFAQMLPSIIKDAIQNNDLFVGQDFVSIEEATRRYHLSRKTIYNYHKKGYITLHTSDGKTFVSIRELEAHIIFFCLDPIYRIGRTARTSIQWGRHTSSRRLVVTYL